MAFESKSIELPTGVTLQYVEQGDPSGVPVVFLHGLGDSSRAFELVLSYLPEEIHALALTLRGHGDSTRPETAYRYHDFAADVKTFMDALELDLAVIVGHSMGSTVAQRFGLDYPERALGLVLLGSFLSLQHSRPLRELWPVVSEMDDPVDPEFVRAFQESVSVRSVPPEFFEDSIMRESMKIPAGVWREVVRCLMLDDFSQELHKIETRTLLLWGDQDGMVPRSDQEAQLEAISGAELVVYEGTGHTIHWEEPDQLAADLVNFADTCRSSTPRSDRRSRTRRIKPDPDSGPARPASL